MTIIDDAQTTAIYNGKGVALPASIALAAGTALTISPTTAVGFQISTARAATLYVNVRTAAALATALSADGSSYTTIDASQSDALGITTLEVPAGWFVKLTGTMANLVCTAILK